MKALLLAARELIVEELDWPDDFSDADIESTALIALGTYFDTSGPRIVPRSHYEFVPYEVRVFAADGRQIRHWKIVDLARSLGKDPP
jgi:hypothetical protein